MSTDKVESEKIFARFLEKNSLYSKIEFPLLVPISRFNFIALQLHCPMCNGERTYKYEMEKSDVQFVPGRKTITTSHQITQVQPKEVVLFNYLENNKTYRLIYCCQSCSVHNYYFLISFQEKNIYKSGQNPRLGIGLDKKLEKTLGNKLVNHYRNGKICEAHSLGIAAMAYYRRVVEDKIFDLLNEVADIFSLSNKEEYLKIVNEVKDSHSFAAKADLLIDVLPPELNDKNGNLVKFLFSKISANLHSKTDEECLTIAHDVSVLLEAIISIINTRADTAKSVKEIASRLK